VVDCYIHTVQFEAMVDCNSVHHMAFVAEEDILQHSPVVDMAADRAAVDDMIVAEVDHCSSLAVAVDIVVHCGHFGSTTFCRQYAVESSLSEGSCQTSRLARVTW
jgi:hypothetical protein